MKILKEFQDLIPPLTTEEYKQLENNCIEEGIRDKILLWNEYIIDGHNRYKIAKQWNLEYQTENKNFSSEGDVKEWMILNQFGRRNLSNYQRSVLALQLEEVFSKKARERMLSGNLSQTFDKGRTDEKIGDVAKVSHETIRKVKKIQEKAPEEVKAKLSTGEVSINAAYKDIKKEEKKEERINLIKEQIENIENGKVPELNGLYDVISIDPAWNYEGENKNITSYNSDGRRIANPYPEMTTEEIKNIKLPLMENSIVFLWSTHKFLPDAIEILKYWGLDYKANFIWNKEKMGMGAWFRMQCEFCLVAIKGKPYWENTKFRDILNEPRRQHSRKPDGFFNMINQITLGRKLEYFSREKRDGWDSFGNDINKF